MSFFWLRGVLQTFLALIREGEEQKNYSSKTTNYFSGFFLLIVFSSLAVLFLVVFRGQFQYLLNGNDPIPFFNWLFIFFFTSDFQLSAKIFNIYLLLIVLRLVFPQTILIGKQITKIFLGVSFAEIVLNIALSFLLVNYIGITGIAYATLLANLFERIILVRIVKRKFRIRVHEYIPVKWYLFYSAAILLIYAIVDFLLFPVT